MDKVNEFEVVESTITGDADPVENDDYYDYYADDYSDDEYAEGYYYEDDEEEKEIIYGTANLSPVTTYA